MSLTHRSGAKNEPGKVKYKEIKVQLYVDLVRTAPPPAQDYQLPSMRLVVRG